MPLGFRVTDLIKASSHRPSPVMPGTFTGKGGWERGEERRLAEEESLRQDALGRGRLGLNMGLGLGQLGMQQRGQDLKRQRFEEEQAAALAAEQRKVREGALRNIMKARMSGNAVEMDNAIQNAKRLGFRVESVGGGPAPAPRPEPVQPEEVKLEESSAPLVTPPETLATPEKLEAFKAAQIQRKKTTPLPGAGLRLQSPPSREQAGVRIYDPQGNQVFEDTDQNVRDWYGKRAATAFGGMIDKYQDDPEAAAAVLSGYSHTMGLIGSGTGADDAIKEGMAQTNAELDRMGKLERTRIMANRPRGGSGAPKEEDFAHKSMVEAVRTHKQLGSVAAMGQQQSILEDALQKAMRGDAIGDVQGIGLYIQSISGKAVTDREYRRLAESTGMSALIARWKGWFTGEGPISQEQMRMLRDSLAQTLRRLRGLRKEYADQAYDYVMNDTRYMKGNNRQTEAENAARAIYRDWSPSGGAPAGGSAPKASAAPKKTSAPAAKGKANPALKKAVMDLLK